MSHNIILAGNITDDTERGSSVSTRMEGEVPAKGACVTLALAKQQGRPKNAWHPRNSVL